MIFAMILQNDQTWDPYSIIITVFVLASCMCAPIGRALQERRLRRMNAQTQRAPVEQEQGENYTGGSRFAAESGRISPLQDKNLQLWEEMLLTTKDHNQKLEAISRLAKLGTKDTIDMLSEYAENDRDPEILAAIENALELLERKQIELRVRGEIEGNPEA